MYSPREMRVSREEQTARGDGTASVPCPTLIPGGRVGRETGDQVGTAHPLPPVPGKHVRSITRKDGKLVQCWI